MLKFDQPGIRGGQKNYDNDNYDDDDDNDDYNVFSSSQKTSNRVGSRWGRGIIYDDDDDIDDNEDDDDDDDDDDDSNGNDCIYNFLGI